MVGNVGRVFARQIQQRCDTKVITTGDAPLTVELTIAPGIGAEGFRIEDLGLRGYNIVDAVRIFERNHNHVRRAANACLEKNRPRRREFPSQPAQHLLFPTLLACLSGFYQSNRNVNRA